MIFDEADRLLELGFQREITEIVNCSNPRRQTLLVSATLPQKLDFIINLSLNKPIRLKANTDNKLNSRLTQMMIKLKNPNIMTREAVLLHILKTQFKQKAIVFFKTKRQCHRVAILMGLLGF